MNANSNFRVVILASGRGSNLQQLLERFCTSGAPLQIVAVVSDNPDSNALKMARERGAQFGVEAIAIDRKQFANRADYDRQLEDTVAAKKPDLIVLAGYMRLLDAGFIKRFPRQIINIHPSLLPAFKGLHAQQQALDAGVKIAGCTVHFVDLEVDSGPIIAQAAVPVLVDDTLETLSQRILTAEHQLLPAVVKLLASGAVDLNSGKLRTTLPADELTLRSPAQHVLKGV